MSDLVEVTKDRFFAHIGPRDVVINLNDPMRCIWETRGRRMVGVSTPGWREIGPKAWFLTRDALESAT